LDPSDGRDFERLKADLSPELELIRPLGRGQWANVYLAQEPALKRLVAVKALLPSLSQDAVARARFEREAQSGGRLNHPNVTAIHRVGQLPGGRPFLVMQYVDGGTMADRLESGIVLGIEEAVTVLFEVASALAAAHKRDIVHRDVRPGNVLRDRETGRTILSDFGLASILASGDTSQAALTQPGEVLGDPTYVSPEQLRGSPVTQASDVYSLGILGYVLLASRGPFEAEGHAQIAISHLEKEPVPVSKLREGIDPSLSDLLLRCLAKDPMHRPSAGDVMEGLRHLSGSSAVTSPRSESLLGDLVRRRVAPIIVAYLAVAWLLLQFVDQLVDRGVLPEGSYRLSLGPFFGGFLAAAILAWFHGAKGKQKVRSLEIWLLIGAAVLGLIVSAIIVAV
jgi:serine/threonine-protein kinase